MKNKKSSSVLLIVLISLLLIILIGFLIRFLCVRKSSKDQLGKSNTQESLGSIDKKQYEKGYDLSIPKNQVASVKKDSIEKMQLLKDSYVNCQKDESGTPYLTKDDVSQMLTILSSTKCPVAYRYPDNNMVNYEKMDDFLKKAKNGEKEEIVVYELRSDGGLTRMQFTYDGKDMYELAANINWDETKTPVVASVSLNRIKEWSYTNLGWFCFELCVPEPPVVTEEFNGNSMLRVLPLSEEYRDIAQKYLIPIGYQGNNLFCSDWDEANLNQLDYSGLFQYLYLLEHQNTIDESQYSNGIPAAEFEELMTKYLPVTKQQLHEYASYDEQSQTYAWLGLGCLNYAPNYFGTSIPEVTNIEQNADGTTIITINAVCEYASNEAALSHVLTVRINEDGTIKYMSNKIKNQGLENVPAYQYRVEK